VDQALYQAFRRRILENIEADLAHEDRAAAIARAEMTAKVAGAIGAARSRGECDRAWLFGSFAWGRPGERSDVDLLVERCSDPDVLSAALWSLCERAVHVVELEKAAVSLVQRVQSDGKSL
jgi:predicted nucleotidyltransferase